MPARTSAVEQTPPNTTPIPVLSPLIHLAWPLNGKSVSRSSGFSSTTRASWILARVTATGLEKLIPLQANYRTISEPVQPPDLFSTAAFAAALLVRRFLVDEFNARGFQGASDGTLIGYGQVCPSTSSASPPIRPMPERGLRSPRSSTGVDTRPIPGGLSHLQNGACNPTLGG